MVEGRKSSLQKDFYIIICKGAIKQMKYVEPL